jgi:hypothetical protein
MVKFLYSSSLNKHMNEYMKDVDLQNQNNQYQLAQAQIVREGEAMQLSQAEIMNKIAQMQESIKSNIAGKMIPRSQTDIIEVPTKKEEYKPMTASEYENKISKKPTIKVENRRGLIDELKEKLQKRKQTQMITEVFPEVNKRDVNKLLDNVLSDIIKKGIKKQDVLKTAEAVVDDIITQSSRRNITKNYVDDMINKALGSASSQATTASSEGIPTSQTLQKQTQGTTKETKELRDRITKAGITPNPLPKKRGGVSRAELNRIESELIESGKLQGKGIKKKRSKLRK